MGKAAATDTGDHDHGDDIHQHPAQDVDQPAGQVDAQDQQHLGQEFRQVLGQLQILLDGVTDQGRGDSPQHHADQGGDDGNHQQASLVLEQAGQAGKGPAAVGRRFDPHTAAHRAAHVAAGTAAGRCGRLGGAVTHARPPGFGKWCDRCRCRPPVRRGCLPR